MNHVKVIKIADRLDTFVKKIEHANVIFGIFRTKIIKNVLEVSINLVLLYLGHINVHIKNQLPYGRVAKFGLCLLFLHF